MPDLKPLDTAEKHELVMKTNKGTLHDRARPEQSPCATASLVQLAKKGFFDGTKFHRIVPRLRHPGRRPDGNGQRRARLHDGRHAAAGRGATRRASSRWRRRAPSRREPRAASSSS